MQFNPLTLIVRFFKHLLNPFLGHRSGFNKAKHPILYVVNFVLWLFLIPIKALEIFGFSVLLNAIFKLITATRNLTEFEQQELKLVFGESLNLSKIKIREHSFLLKLTRQKGMGYVWMQTICFSRQINCVKNHKDMAWLVHEAVHVLQFKKLGIQYVFEALLAQHIGGYKYGGTSNLKSHKLSYFNLEQQADIARDYYLALKNNRRVDDYEKMIVGLKNGKF